MFIGGRDAGDTYQSSPAHVFSPRCPSRGAPTDPPGTGSSGGFGASPYNSSGSAIPTACGHQTGDTWRNLRQELDRMHLVYLRPRPTPRRRNVSAQTSDQKTIVAALDPPEPPKYLDFTPGINAAVPN